MAANGTGLTPGLLDEMFGWGMADTALLADHAAVEALTQRAHQAAMEQRRLLEAASQPAATKGRRGGRGGAVAGGRGAGSGAKPALPTPEPPRVADLALQTDESVAWPRVRPGPALLHI